VTVDVVVACGFGFIIRPEDFAEAFQACLCGSVKDLVGRARVEIQEDQMTLSSVGFDHVYGEIM
jgi:hypothetical protein